MQIHSLCQGFLRSIAMTLAAGMLTLNCVAQQSNGGLPDVIGIRPGMAIGDAYKVLKAHDPKGAIKFGQRRIAAVSDKPITHAFLYSPTSSTDDMEVILADITFPPSQQVVWRVTRLIRFPEEKEVPKATLLAALRQKYGPEIPASNPQFAYWVFDEQGHPANRNAGINLADCAQYVELPSNVASTLSLFTDGRLSSESVPGGVALYPSNVVANRDACQAYVFVVAYLVPGVFHRDLVGSVTVAITDLGAGIRAGKATQSVMNNAVAAQQQKELKKAQQQAAPTF